MGEKIKVKTISPFTFEENGEIEYDVDSEAYKKHLIAEKMYNNTFVHFEGTGMEVINIIRDALVANGIKVYPNMANPYSKEISFGFDGNENDHYTYSFTFRKNLRQKEDSLEYHRLKELKKKEDDLYLNKIEEFIRNINDTIH